MEEKIKSLLYLSPLELVNHYTCNIGSGSDYDIANARYRGNTVVILAWVTGILGLLFNLNVFFWETFEVVPFGVY